MVPLLLMSLTFYFLVSVFFSTEHIVAPPAFFGLSLSLSFAATERQRMCYLFNSIQASTLGLFTVIIHKGIYAHNALQM